MLSALIPSVFKTKPLVDENTADFIFSTAVWVLKYFDHEEFFKRTRLIAPNNEFFPGRVSSVDEKADTIFQHTLRYCGVLHWPFTLNSLANLGSYDTCQVQPSPQSELAVIRRNSYPQALVMDELTGKFDNSIPVIISDQPLHVFYNPQQTLKPEDLSASYAHVIAQHLMIQAKQLPPGGQQFFAEASEVLAGMMGFGVLLANSAYTFRGGCGSCYNAMANRQPALTEFDNVFVLALFCRLKGLSKAEATRHLKKHLRASYKQALSQIDKRLQQDTDFKLLLSAQQDKH